MHEQRMTDEVAGTDARLVRALERKPDVNIPDGFATRVARQLPVLPVVAVTFPRYGLMSTWICMALLLIALMVVASRFGGRSIFGIALQWLLCAQLVAIGMWLGGWSFGRAGDGEAEGADFS